LFKVQVGHPVKGKCNAQMLLPLILVFGITAVAAYSDTALIDASKGFSLFGDDILFEYNSVSFNGDGMEERGIRSSFDGKHLHVLPSNVRF